MKRPRPAATATVKFVKATACGNDFIIIAARDAVAAGNDLADFSRRICDRHNGVGADGVEWLYSSDQADIEARLFNSDGSAAELSGNGTRCVAAFWADAAAIEGRSPSAVSVLTGAGNKEFRLTGHDGWRFDFEADMGVPRVEDELSFSVNGAPVKGIPVSMGNPHYVVFVDAMQLRSADISETAAAIARDGHFPEGVNVEFAHVSDASNIHLRIFERGAGETMSSGTGSCAAGAAAFITSRVKSSINVHSAGGSQRVVWDGHRGVMLAGPAKIICRGEFLL